MPPLRPRSVLNLATPSSRFLRVHSSLPSVSAQAFPSLSLSPSPSPSPSSLLHPAFQPSAGQFSTSAIRTSDHEASHYDPPSGWLFGVPPGEKYKKEGWENVWVYGFWGSILMVVIGYAYKPDTSIQTWALEEARRRLEAEGILPDPGSEKNP